MDIANVLERAADLLGKPGAWTQGCYGRDASGCEVMLVSDAVCFCAMGAIYAAAGKQEFDHDGDLVEPLATILYDEGIDDWNDAGGRTQAEVVAKLREAAAKARESAA